MWLWLTESVPEAKGKDEEERLGDVSFVTMNSDGPHARDLLSDMPVCSSLCRWHGIDEGTRQLLFPVPSPQTASAVDISPYGKPHRGFAKPIHFLGVCTDAGT